MELQLEEKHSKEFSLLLRKNETGNHFLEMYQRGTRECELFRSYKGSSTKEGRVTMDDLITCNSSPYEIFPFSMQHG